MRSMETTCRTRLSRLIPHSAINLLAKITGKITEWSLPVSQIDIDGLTTDANKILRLFDNIRVKCGQDFALASTIMAIFSEDLDGFKSDFRVLTNRIFVPFEKNLGKDFSRLSLRNKIYSVRNYIDMPCTEAFTNKFYAPGESFRRVAEHRGPIGDCNNLSLLFLLLARRAGLSVSYYMDIYHSFLSVDEQGKKVPVDLSYSDNITETYYEVNKEGISAKESHRRARCLTDRQILALFLCRRATEHIKSQEQKKLIFETVRTIDLFFAEAHNNLGDIHFARGEYQEALECYEKAIEREDYNIFFKLNRLLTIYVLNQNTDKRMLLSDLDEIFEIYPVFAEAFYFRYLLTKDKADQQEAEKRGYKTRPLIFYCRDTSSKLDYIEGII